MMRVVGARNRRLKSIIVREKEKQQKLMLQASPVSIAMTSIEEIVKRIKLILKNKKSLVTLIERLEGVKNFLVKSLNDPNGAYEVAVTFDNQVEDTNGFWANGFCAWVTSAAFLCVEATTMESNILAANQKLSSQMLILALHTSVSEHLTRTATGKKLTTNNNNDFLDHINQVFATIVDINNMAETYADNYQSAWCCSSAS